MEYLIQRCNELYDYDSLSLINVKYDLDSFFDDGEMEEVGELFKISDYDLHMDISNSTLVEIYENL